MSEDSPVDSPAPQETSSCCSSSASSCPVRDTIVNNPFFVAAKDVVLWENPIRSGVVFVAVNTLFYLIRCRGYSFLSLVTLSQLAALLVAGLFYAFHRFVRGQTDSPFANWTLTIPHETFEAHSRTFEALFNAVVASLTYLLLFSNPVASAQYATGLLFMTWLSYKIRLMTLAWLTVVVVFVWPRLYREKKELIDEYAGQAYSVASEKVRMVYGMVLEKLPPSIGPIKIKSA
eukprot:m51a1_g9816 hypothetical protein (232) ;mRNA; f:1865589-1866909